jgi:hypothetical protein
MNYGEEKHGVVYFNPREGFIEVRERYFNLKTALRDNPDKELKAGHFAEALGDSKNDVPLGGITPRVLKGLLNIEEVGLNNIPEAYQNDRGDWWCHVERTCPTCGRVIER